MDFAIAQLARGPAQPIEKLQRLLLFWVDVGMKNLTPRLESPEAGAIEVCTFGRGLMPQIGYGSQQPFQRRVEFISSGLTEDRHLEGSQAAEKSTSNTR